MKGTAVIRYLEKYPDVPTLTLAKKIYKENVALFKDVENVRRLIRYYTGKCGEKEFERVGDKRFVKTEIATKNPFESLPEGIKHFKEWRPYHIKEKNILVLADIHAPFHERGPLEIALEYGYKKDIDCVLLLGDFVDFYTVSFWEKDPEKRDFQNELEITRSILKIIRDAFPKAKIVYLKGNHEERYTRYMQVKAPELLNVPDFTFKKIMRLDDFEIKLVENKRIVKIGALNCVHGHEFGRSISSPVNPARGLYLRGKETAIAGHWHQTSQHNEKTMSDKVVSCHSCGALCDLRPDYLPINKWNHGFMRILRDGKQFDIENKKIINGRVY